MINPIIFCIISPININSTMPAQEGLGKYHQLTIGQLLPILEVATFLRQLMRLAGKEERPVPGTE